MKSLYPFLIIDLITSSEYILYIKILPYSTLPSPPLFSPSLSIWKNLGLWKNFQQKILCKKLHLQTYCELDFLIFVCFSYLIQWINHKTTIQSHFWYKNCKILENFGKFLKIKNNRCLVPLTNLGKFRSFRGD